MQTQKTDYPKVNRNSLIPTDTGVMDLRISKPRIHMPDASIVNVSEKQKQSLPMRM
jgi:hypothetical protein